MNTQQKCIEQISKIVIDDYKNCPILPSVRISQICLESGWLKSELSIKAKNCCGIKWSSYKTKQKYLYKNEYWSSFKTIDECIRQQGVYYTSKPHYYSKVIGEQDLLKSLKALNDSPYCENKEYASKLYKLIKQYNLEAYDDKVKRSDCMKKIWIDAGHSSLNNGASGNGIKEEDYVLSISIKLGKLLENNGFKVGYSRKNGNTNGNVSSNNKDLENRCRSANSFNADFFISLHNNASSNATANGVETLVYDKRCKNAIRLANMIQRNICYELKMRDRGIKFREDLYVLKATKMDSLLVELGFLSNKEDALKLKDETNQMKIAECISHAILEYYSISFTRESKDNTYENAIKKLAKHKIITTEKAWERPNIKYIPEVITSVCNKKYGINGFEESINILSDAKIITNKEIWLNRKWKENHVRDMIIKLSTLL